MRGCDIIQPDICVVGGLSEMLQINALAQAHFVSVAPHNPMGPLATAINVHFCATQPNFRILEYRLPHGAAYVYGSDSTMKADDRLQGAWYVKDPYLPKDGYLELRPDRPGRRPVGAAPGPGRPARPGLGRRRLRFGSQSESEAAQSGAQESRFSLSLASR